MTEDDDAWRRLLHRWFVQYNPLYLLSATLVLGGTTVLSRAVVTQRIFHGGLAIGAITELYAVMLIVSAAVLVRMRQRRPAVLLALLAVVFECDVTMQVETYAWYGTVGVAASGAWVLLAMGKLWGLSRALRLRASASAWGTIALGASGLAAFPHLLRGVGPSATWTLVAAWLFAVGASALWTRRRVICEDSMDARGRRCVRGTWRLWGGALLAHVAYWSTDVRGFDAVVLIAALGLLSARWMRRERHVWALCAATVVGVALLAPAHLSLIAFLAAATLLLRALRGPARVLEAAPAPSSPYRVASTSDDPTPRVVFVRASQPALHRLCVGAASALYLGAWTAGWVRRAAARPRARPRSRVRARHRADALALARVARRRALRRDAAPPRGRARLDPRAARRARARRRDRRRGLRRARGGAARELAPRSRPARRAQTGRRVSCTGPAWKGRTRTTSKRRRCATPANSGCPRPSTTGISVITSSAISPASSAWRISAPPST